MGGSLSVRQDGGSSKSVHPDPTGSLQASRPIQSPNWPDGHFPSASLLSPPTSSVATLLRLSHRLLSRQTKHTPNSPKEDGEAEEDWSGPTNKKGEPSQNIADYDDPFECPCVQTLVQGPCGTEFKTAYLCFINSNEEQKGMDCVDLFIAMQDCFKEHPETFEKYAALSGGDDDDDDDEEEFDEPPTPSPEPSTPVDSQPSTDASPNTADEKQQDSK